MHGAAFEDRREAGRALRKVVARAAHASAPVSERDPVALVLADNEGRDADLVPVRHHRMAVSAFTSCRGTASLMALDLATTPTTGVTGYLGGGPVADRAIAEFARLYAARAREDHAAFIQAIADGRVEASPDRTSSSAAPTSTAS